MKRREILIGGMTTISTLACGTDQEKQKESPVYSSTMNPATFIGGPDGKYRVERLLTIRGEPLPAVGRLDVRVGILDKLEGSWALRGVTSYARYVSKQEKTPLDEASPKLGRAEASKSVLIPIKKSSAWWSLPQDERRAIFEERSHHIADSMQYLPRIARRLYHSRELGEPFDFLTWFEFAPEHSQAFDDLLGMLRSREEWTYVEREVELRLENES